MLNKALTLSIVTILFASLFSQNALAAFPDDLDDVVFIEEASVPGTASLIRSMAVTASLSVNITGAHPFGGQNIIMDSSRKNSWPVGRGDLNCCNANAWGIINVNGTWYAGTWEFLRRGQTTKSTLAFVGAKHFRHPPLNRFTPKVGEIYGFFVAGITRNNLGRLNIRERSEIALFKFGVGPVSADEVRPEVAESNINLNPIINSILDD